MARDITIEGETPKRVAKDVMEIMSSRSEGGVIKQELKTHISLKNPDTGDEVKVSDFSGVEGGTGPATHVDMTLASSELRELIMESYGGNGESRVDVVGEQPGPGKSVSERMMESAGMGEVFKPFSHEDADYREPGDPDFESGHERCESCAHYDDHGNCHIVPDIEPDGYCAEFYADVGVFGHEHPWGIENNLNLFGESFDWSIEGVENFVNDIRERLEEKIRGS